ncbi:MAG: hypothetical protein ACJAR2_003215 [Ilumatobacter sp.]
MSLEIGLAHRACQQHTRPIWSRIFCIIGFAAVVTIWAGLTPYCGAVADRLNRDDVARILNRAQAIEHAGDAEMSDGIDSETLIEAAAEVGIDRNAVRDSLAVERLAIEPAGPPSRLDRLVGPRNIVIERELPVTVPAAIAGTEAWLTSVHKLLCDRRSTSTLHARRRSDVSARFGRFRTSVRGDGRLGTVGSLDIEAVPLIVGSTPARPRTLVRARADRSAPRSVRLGVGSAAGVAGAGVGATAIALGGAMLVVPLISLPLIGGGFFVARSGLSHGDRLELELERLLSLVERGEKPVGMLGRAARRARRAALRSSN